MFLCLAASSHAAFADALQEAGKLFKKGQYPLAMKDVDAWLSKHPKDVQGRFLKGLILTKENKLEDAIKVFHGLTVDYPRLPEPYNNLAVIYAAQGNYEKAKDELEAAIQTHPSYATAHENLGDIYAKLASQAYDKALQLGKSNANAAMRLTPIDALYSREPAYAAPVRIASSELPETAKIESAPEKPVAKLAEKPEEKPVAKPVGKPAAKQEEKVVAQTEKKPEPKSKPEPEKKTEAKSKPEPEKKTEAKPVARHKPKPDETVDEAKAVVSSINAWARAWSNQNVEAYLAHYADDFKPADGRSLAHWKALRKARLKRPKHISVKVSDPEISLKGRKHATIRFKQSYASSSMKETTVKIITLSKVGGKWLIETEKVGH